MENHESAELDGSMTAQGEGDSQRCLKYDSSLSLPPPLTETVVARGGEGSVALLEVMYRGKPPGGTHS